MAIDRFYITCYRLRPTETLNDRLRAIKTYITTQIKGYIGSRSNVQIRIADKDTSEIRLKFYCDDFDLQSTDIIKYENKTYEIVGELQNTVHKGHHIKATLRMVDNVKQE